MNPRRLNWHRWWLHNRIPLVGGWLRRRSARILAADDSPGAIHLLAAAVSDPASDPAVRTAALDAFGRLESPPGIDAFCLEWAATRDPDLTRLLTERGW